MQEAFDQAGEGEIPFISKSKVQKWDTCPRQFYEDVVEDRDTDDDEDSSEAMERGLAVHDTFEQFYENAVDYVDEHGEAPDRLVHLLPDDESLWEDVLDPYVTNFLAFESRRLTASDTVEEWLPVGIEEEAWNNEDPPWMGRADVFLNASSIPTLTADQGVVLTDFKTGSKPHPEFREGAIFLQLEYYAMLFDQRYDIVALGGYYPKSDAFLTTSRDEDRRERIRTTVDEIIAADNEDPSDFPAEEQALCCWGDGDGQRCPFYEECPSQWAVPADNQSEFRDACREHETPEAVAEAMGITEDAVEYWLRKLDR